MVYRLNPSTTVDPPRTLIQKDADSAVEIRYQTMKAETVTMISLVGLSASQVPNSDQPLHFTPLK